MTDADLQHLRHICERAACNATVTLMPVRVLRDLLRRHDAVRRILRLSLKQRDELVRLREELRSARVRLSDQVDGLAGRGA